MTGMTTSPPGGTGKLRRSTGAAGPYWMWTGTRRTARIFAAEIRLVMVRDPRPIICGFAAIAMSCVLWSGGLPSPVAPATAAPSPVAGAYPDISLQVADQLRRLWQLVDASTGRIALLETRMAKFEARSNAIVSNAPDALATSASQPVPIVSAGALPPPTPIGAAVSAVIPPASQSQATSLVSFAQPSSPVQTAAAAPSPIGVTVAALAPPAASTPRNLVPPTESTSVFAPAPAPTPAAPAALTKPISAQPIPPAPDAGKAPSAGARQVLRAVAGNRAWISKGPDGDLRQVAVGDTIPGYGRVKAIQMRGASYVVACDRGEIVS